MQDISHVHTRYQAYSSKLRAYFAREILVKKDRAFAKWSKSTFLNIYTACNIFKQNIQPNAWCYGTWKSINKRQTPISELCPVPT